jgi:hypothetical protein
MKILNCTNKAYIIHLGGHLDKVKHKWESRVRKRLIDNKVQFSLNVSNSVYMEETVHRKKQVLHGVFSHNNVYL